MVNVSSGRKLRLWPNYADAQTGLNLRLIHIPCNDKVIIFFHILVLQEYWVLVKSRIPLKPMLGGMIIFALSISSHERLNETESAVF